MSQTCCWMHRALFRFMICTYRVHGRSCQLFFVHRRSRWLRCGEICFFYHFLGCGMLKFLLAYLSTSSVCAGHPSSVYVCSLSDFHVWPFSFASEQGWPTLTSGWVLKILWEFTIVMIVPTVFCIATELTTMTSGSVLNCDRSWPCGQWFSSDLWWYLTTVMNRCKYNVQAIILDLASLLCLKRLPWLVQSFRRICTLFFVASRKPTVATRQQVFIMILCNAIVVLKSSVDHNDQCKPQSWIVS
jgi:hypothetical protein